MRLLSLCLGFFLAACAPGAVNTARPTAPAPDVWQEGPKGWVHGPSPFYLSPAGIDENHTSVTIPRHIAFSYGSAELDLNGRLIAGLQGQRASQLRHYDAALVCGWSMREEDVLGLMAAKTLAAERCRSVIDVYRLLDLRIHVAVRLRRTASAARDHGADAESFATLALVPSGRGRQGPRLDHHRAVRRLIDRSGTYVVGIYFEGLDGIFLTLVLAFPRDSATLSANGHSLLSVMAAVSLPAHENMVLINCVQNEGEGGTAPADNALARRRCEVIRDLLLQRGLCEHRVVFGENSIYVVREIPNRHNVNFSIFETQTSATGEEC